MYLSMAEIVICTNRTDKIQASQYALSVSWLKTQSAYQMTLYLAVLYIKFGKQPTACEDYPKSTGDFFMKVPPLSRQIQLGIPIPKLRSGFRQHRQNRLKARETVTIIILHALMRLV